MMKEKYTDETNLDMVEIASVSNDNVLCRNKIEILAPVGGAHMVSAAVNCGANAVYLGFGALNARKSAKNFDSISLRETIDYCHIRNVAVHLTLNTLVFDNEFDELKRYIVEAAELGVDAVIVQDLAVAKFVREMCPSMPIHGSTQMSVNSVGGAKMLEEMGFSRVVLARELSKKEIKHIVHSTAIETEIFVHGAHCMSVSGQCTMSAMIGQRSGNRGMCAQPCRLPFGKRENSGEYNLSLKDMSVIYDLKELMDMGVSSVKIEGRMKRPEYVAAAVTACVAALNGEPPEPHMKRLEKVFSRSGFTDGFYRGKLDSSMYGVRSKGDVLSAKEVLSELSELYDNEKPMVPVRFKYIQKHDIPVSLTVWDDRGNSVSVQADPPQKAVHKPTDSQRVLTSLQKLGGTPYYISNTDRDVQFDMDDGLMVSVSVINRLRRECVGEMDRLRSEGFEKECIPFSETSNSDKIHKKGISDSLPKLRAVFRHKKSIPMDFLGEYEYVYIPVKLALEMSQELEKYKSRIILLPPRVMFGKEEEILKDFSVAKLQGFERVCAVNIGDFYWAKQMDFAIHGGFGLNCVNSLSLSEYTNLGAVDMELSTELDLGHLNRMDSVIPVGIAGYGHVPVMLTRNCPGRAVGSCAGCSGNIQMIDRLGNKFSVSCNEYKTASEIYNCNPIYLGDKLDELRKCDFINLHFTDETSDEVGRITKLYKNGEKGFVQNITRGLIYRGIL